MRSTFMPHAVWRWPCAVLALLSLAAPALAQTANPPAAHPPPVIQAPAEATPPPPPDPAAPALPRIPTPGETLGAIGRFIDQSISNVGAGVKGAGDAVGGATSAAGEIAKGVGDAAGTVAKLPLSNVVAGFERCTMAPNGGADCEAASVALCRAKGYAGGKSVDITSSQKCPAAVWLERRDPKEGECLNETFVSKAICQ